MLEGVNFILHYLGALFFGSAILIGMAVMFSGGVYIGCVILDWMIERILRSLEIYREFLAFAGPRVMKRARNRG